MGLNILNEVLTDFNGKISAKNKKREGKVIGCELELTIACKHELSNSTDDSADKSSNKIVNIVRARKKDLMRAMESEF